MRNRILICIMSLTMLFGFPRCGRNTNADTNKTITSVESMTLTLHGMRGSVVYKFEIEDDASELCQYQKIYRNGKDELVPERSVPCTPQTMIDRMNTCGIPRWNGFHGKHPRYVLDGIMFRFEAAVNGGQTIEADGSANFPEGYSDFVRTLDAMLAESGND